MWTATATLDFLSAYSAVNFGHSNPELVKVAIEQLGKVSITSRAVYSATYGPFIEALAKLCGKQMVLPMNTGVEAVESSLKLARKWGYEVKGVPEDRANIIVMEGNFHGRTISVISFSSDSDATDSYGPFTPGFAKVPYGDLAAIEDAMDADTVAILVEPIQGEAGVITPPPGFLAGVRELADRHGVLMIADEIQSGLARTGTTFYCEQEGVVPDLYLLGKALGGRHRARLCRGRGRRRARPAQAGPARLDLRRQPAGGSRRARRRAAAGDRRDAGALPASSGPTCTSGWTNCSDAAPPRCAASACGPAWTSTPRWAPDARSASACSPRG